ncbi:MAG TPA: potassium/proton antiporter [Candidatus Hydrogenedentes bacterium]|jgi:cell volume regulation protein A|nr:potassium/proton antiporter [Candidatus Hydrogenedentota bacterium]
MLTPSLILLAAGFLVLTSILASRASERLGVPALIVFLCIGMLAGVDGFGGIQFDNARAANLLGEMALAFILFSGGLSTNWRIARPVAVPSFILSTFGVLVTAVLVGMFAWAVVGLDILNSVLLGAIISSTDAAAVFSILRSRGVGLKGQLKPLLELESGSNDPMAVFLTIGMTRVLTVPDFQWMDLVPFFLLNMGGGLLVGFVVGKIAVFLFNRIRLDYDGLYPVLSMSLVLLTFGAAEELRGNGFLAVYLCGILLNGSDFAFKRSVEKFHDGIAWLMQIVMFLALGLLVNPSSLPAIAPQGILAALFLMFVARPVAVALGLMGSGFLWRERLLVAWTGLRGAVPIVLATFPLLAGYENSDILFNIVFFIVLTSVLVQGTLLMPVARLLKVDKPLAARPVYSLEIARSGLTQGETREIEILPNMGLVGHTVADLILPPEVLVLLIGRGEESIVPRGHTQIEPYDTLLLLGKPEALHEASEAILSPTLPRHRRIPDDPMTTLPLSTEEKYLSKQVVVIGYGHLGKHVCDILAASKIPFVVADQDREIVERLRAQGQPAVVGDGATAMALAQAHVARAAVLVITTPDVLKTLQTIELARILNPNIDIVVRAQSEMEAALLKKEQVNKILLPEVELAKTITKHILRRMPDTLS